MLRYLLEKKELLKISDEISESISSIFDASVFRKYSQLKQSDQIILLTVYSDGVEIEKSSSKQGWPIWIKVHNIKSSEEDKIFLYSNFYGDCKPELTFYLKSLVDELNFLFINGIFIEKLNSKVYPMVVCCLFDMPAKSFFLNHIGHTGYFSCTICLIKGEYSKEFRKIIFGQLNDPLRDFDVYHEILRNECLPHLGLNGKSDLSNIIYLNIFKSSPIDAMHTLIGGLSKQLFGCMLNLKNSFSHLPKDSQNVLHRRLMKFGATSDFKRFPRDLNVQSQWKTNEYFHIVVYQSPIVFKDLLNDNVYHHWLALVYVITKLFSGPLNNEQLTSIENIIELIFKDVDNLYGESQFTLNCHAFTHSSTNFRDLGPMEGYNAFIFESMKGMLKDFVHSPSGVNHQIADRYATFFFSHLTKSYRKSEEWKLSKSKNKIKKDEKTITTLKSEKSKSSNYFIATNDGSYYLINKFCVINEVDHFAGVKFRVEKFKFSYKRINLYLEYILKCELTDILEYLPIAKIDRKVHFVKEFKKLSSKVEYERKGYLIDIKFKYHN